MLLFCCCLVFKEWLKRNEMEMIHPIKQLNYWMVIVGVTTKKMNLNSTTTTKKKIHSNAISADYIYMSLPFDKVLSRHIIWVQGVVIVSESHLRAFLLWTDGDTRPTACFVICLKQIGAKKSVHVRTLSPRWVCLLGLGEKAESRCSCVIMESLFPPRHPGSGTGLFIIQRLLARLFNLQILVFVLLSADLGASRRSAAEK